MNSPNPINENIPSIMKFVGFEESILAWPKLQSTIH